MAIFKSMLLKLLEQHDQIYVVLFYSGLIIIITGISDLRGGGPSMVALIHFDCSAGGTPPLCLSGHPLCRMHRRCSVRQK